MLGFSLPETSSAAAAAGAKPAAVNAFVSIARDGSITFFNPFVEMGQGTFTSVALPLMEELDADLSALRVEEAPIGPAYRIQFNNTLRITGGSSSVRSSYDTLRRAGATARAMLIAAAAQQWGVPDAEIGTEPGFVIHSRSGRRVSYGELAPAAAALQPPAEVKLKDARKFRILGKPVPRTDAAVKANGQAIFGIDVQADGMLVAAVKQSPVWGGKAEKVDQSAVANMPGVVAVEELSNGVAVLADNYWHARKALDKLPVQFGGGTAPQFSSEAYLAKIRSRLDEEGYKAENRGDARAAFASAAKKIEAEYHAPFLAHATMEPQNCSALVKDGRCTVWAPNQAIDFVAQIAAKVANLPLEAIEVHTPFLGGGFGRRVVLDYVEHAVTLAARHPGKPVKVIWSREEDMQHDYYRPLTAAKYRAGFDANNQPVAVSITTVGDGPGRQLFKAFMQNPDFDDSVVEGSYEEPYAVPNWRSDYVYEPCPAPLGFWRSVGNSHNAFFKESFIDEMAHAAGQDPVAFRRTLLQKEPRFLKVLDTAAAMAKWNGGKRRTVDGREHAMGIALHKSFGSIVAEVVEVSLDESGLPVVHKVWCAIDCGFAVNPLLLVHQAEGAIAFGLSAALHEEITIKDGRTVNGNFDTYPILTAQEMPEVAVQIINSGEALGGIGEVATPPIAPAVCNALFTLTGKRVRSLPLSSQTFA